MSKHLKGPKITSDPRGFNVDGSLISDQIKVANHFNRYFTTVAEKLVNELPAQIGILNDKLVKEYYAKCGITPGGFLFTKIEESNVFKKLTNLKSSKATGLDNIPVKFLNVSQFYYFNGYPYYKSFNLSR